MEIEDYKMLLDSMHSTGIYVIREDNHEILYLNRHVREIVPAACEGMICNEVFSGACGNCPLLYMGEKNEGRAVHYDSPFGSIMDVTATRITWQGDIPAIMLQITPHAETAGYTYNRILRANLTTDSFGIVREDENNALLDYGHQIHSLSEWFRSFLKNGNVYIRDIGRFEKFIRIEYLREEFKKGKRTLSCTYRRKVSDVYRWYTMEIVPDYDYADDNQTVMLYVKDVQDAYRKGLEFEESNIRHKEIFKSVSEKNFGIYIIELSTGMISPTLVSEDMKDLLEQGIVEWNAVLGKMVMRYFHPESREDMLNNFSWEALKAASVGNEKKKSLLCRRMLYGKYHYVSVAAHFYTDDEGGAYAILVQQDVDEHTREEIKRSQSDKRISAIIKSHYNVMNIVDLDTGICERSYLDIEGTQKDNSIGDWDHYLNKACGEFIDERDAKRFLSVLSLGALRAEADKVEDFDEFTYQFRTKHDTVKWLEEQVFFSRQDKNVLVSILGRDITQRKLKEDAALEAEREKQHIINSLSTLFFSIYYLDLRMETLHPIIQMGAVGEVLKQEAECEEVFALYAQNFVHPDDRAEYLGKMNCRYIRETLGSEQAFIAVEYRILDKDNVGINDEYSWVRATVLIAQSEGGVPVKALYVAQDVTESKRREELEQKMLKEACEAANHASAAKSEFLSKMSHDIRTPMNAIIGMAMIAQLHIRNTQKVEDCLNKIDAASKHLLSLINNVLDMSKIESGKITLAEEEFNLNELLQGVLDTVRPSVQSKMHEIRLTVGDIEHRELIGDVMRLQQVFTNILGNAIKYTPPGGKLEFRVNERPSQAPGYGCFVFEFEDNGIGMSQEYIEQIFEPFSRAEDSRVSKIEGTGLGMPIALNIIRRMNGSIDIKSEVNVGSCFIVTIFLKYQDKPIEIKDEFANQVRQYEDIDLGGKRILLVEDNEINREIASEIISDLGIKVESAEDGKDALDIYLEKGAGYYDLIFMDIQMPVMNGYQATEAIRASGQEDARTIPIVAMTANVFTEDIIASKNAGMNEHITKPLSLEQLVGCIVRWTERTQ